MKMEEKLYGSLERIVSYYDKRDFRCPTMDDQAKGKHENTMFGEARKVLKEYEERGRLNIEHSTLNIE